VIELEANAGVAWLWLNRPEALNALNRLLTGALEEALERVTVMDDVRVLVVAGRGRAFCAGNDIKEMETVTTEEAEALARRHAALMDRFATLPQVTIAAVDGYALGGGLMLAVAQDLRVASDRARFGLPEVTLGFNPGYGIARLLDIVAGGLAPPTLSASVAALAADIARSPRGGLAATKEIVAAIRAGARGCEAEGYGAALRTSAAARERIREFASRRKR